MGAGPSCFVDHPCLPQRDEMEAGKALQKKEKFHLTRPQKVKNLMEEGGLRKLWVICASYRRNDELGLLKSCLFDQKS